jgi:hypothetical protein
LTALVALGSWIGPPIVREVRARLWPPEVKKPARGPYMVIRNRGIERRVATP